MCYSNVCTLWVGWHHPYIESLLTLYSYMYMASFYMHICVCIWAVYLQFGWVHDVLPQLKVVQVGGRGVPPHHHGLPSPPSVHWHHRGAITLGDGRGGGEREEDERSGEEWWGGGGKGGGGSNDERKRREGGLGWRTGDAGGRGVTTHHIYYYRMRAGSDQPLVD